MKVSVRGRQVVNDTNPTEEEHDWKAATWAAKAPAIKDI